MDFTSPAQLSPPSTHSQPNFQLSKPIPFSSLSEELFTVLGDIDRINYQRSFIEENIEEEEEVEKQSDEKSDGSQGQERKEEEEFDFLPKPIAQLAHRKSNIFCQSSTTERSQRESSRKSENKIKIYYFQQPISKMVPYNEETTIFQIISAALSLFVADKSREQSFLTTFDPKDYELRFTENQNSFQPDMEINAIQRDRKISQGFFDSLVLIESREAIHSFRESFSLVQRQSISQVLQNEAKGMARIRIMNEINTEIGSLTVSHENSLQQIFNYIDKKQIYYEKYYITQNLTDEFQLPRDFLIKNLTSYNLYVKSKKFADESEVIPKRLLSQNLISILPKNAQSIIPLPIGLKEASMYEEFPVIKVNSRGIEQKRIMGIDQMKIFNYDEKRRTESKQPGLLSMIFGGNQETGTQTPYTLIKDVQKLQRTKQGFRIIQKQKTRNYIVKELEMREKIVRKLDFLIKYNKS